MKRIFWVAIFWALSVTAAVFPAAALTNCAVGQQVSDPLGGNGIVDWSGGGFCRVKYEGGVSHGWTAASLRAVEAPTKPNIGVRNSSSSAAPDAGAKEAGDGIILKPAPKSLVYRADPLGHFQLTAAVNGAPIRVVVDTGATVVSLSLADAAAVGIDPQSLAYTVKASTANGESRAAPVMLSNVSIGQISIDNVPAVVAEKLKYSLLGMSFLSRLTGFEIREGSLTINR